MEWCGITIESNGRTFPSTPHQLRLDFGSSEKVIDDLQTLDEVRHYYHRWLGIANVGNRWMNQELGEKTFQLRKIHKSLSEQDLQQAKKVLMVYARLLNDWWENENGAFSLTLGASKDGVSVAIVDANKEAWYGTLLYLTQVEREKDAFVDLSDEANIVKAACEKLELRTDAGKILTLIPCIRDGEKFSTELQKASSTTRER